MFAAGDGKRGKRLCLMVPGAGIEPARRFLSEGF